jgi:hypothetical protein
VRDDDAWCIPECRAQIGIRRNEDTPGQPLMALGQQRKPLV